MSDMRIALFLSALLAMSGCAATGSPKPAGTTVHTNAPGPGDAVQRISDIATNSSCAAIDWKDRGRAPRAYIRGMALVFADAACNRSRSDVVTVAQASTHNGDKDALAWYDAIFQSAGMSNEQAGVDTLRHAFTLLIGLGMRESSGRHCTGRDRSAENTTAETAEAGLFQTSFDSRTKSAELPKLFARYRTQHERCGLDVFQSGVSCSAADWSNWGSGDGAEFQKLEKECPVFAAQYAAVMLRVDGGKRGHYGPLRARAAQVHPECDAMLHQVQMLVDATPAICSEL